MNKKIKYKTETQAETETKQRASTQFLNFSPHESRVWGVVGVQERRQLSQFHNIIHMYIWEGEHSFIVKLRKAISQFPKNPRPCPKPLPVRLLGGRAWRKSTTEAGASGTAITVIPASQPARATPSANFILVAHSLNTTLSKVTIWTSLRPGDCLRNRPKWLAFMTFMNQ